MSVVGTTTSYEYRGLRAPLREALGVDGLFTASASVLGDASAGTISVTAQEPNNATVPVRAYHFVGGEVYASAATDKSVFLRIGAKFPGVLTAPTTPAAHTIQCIDDDNAGFVSYQMQGRDLRPISESLRALGWIGPVDNRSLQASVLLYGLNSDFNGTTVTFFTWGYYVDLTPGKRLPRSF